VKTTQTWVFLLLCTHPLPANSPQDLRGYWTKLHEICIRRRGIIGVDATSVALTGRNTTGPGELRCAAVECYSRRQTINDDDRRQRAKQYWPQYTMYRGPAIIDVAIVATAIEWQRREWRRDMSIANTRHKSVTIAMSLDWAVAIWIQCHKAH